MATQGHRRQLLALFLGLGGAILTLLYILGPSIPLWVSVPSFTLIAGWVIAGPTTLTSSIAFLPRVSMLVYIMPFLHMWGYLIWDDFVFFPSAPLSYGYQLDPHILSQLGLVGLIGAIGLTDGLLLANAGTARKSRPDQHPEPVRSLGMLPFLCILMLSLLVSWLDAPIQTILVGQYVDIASETRFGDISFTGGALLSYVLMVVLAIDMLKEKVKPLRQAKLLLIGIGFVVTLVWFQLLRGNRDILGLILGFLSLSLYAATPEYAHLASREFATREPIQARRTLRNRLVVLLVALGLTYFSFQVLGDWRGSASLGESLSETVKGAIEPQHFVTGTWTAALLTPLSTVGDLELGFKQLRYGETYLDIFLSLPPGPLARAIGYVRPFDRQETNLAWQMTYGAGGTHAVVSPLLNFSAPGVLIILGLVGFFLGQVENKVSSGSDWDLFFQTTLIVGSAHFFWYGEIYWIRGVMAAVAVWWMYRALLRFKLLSAAAARETPFVSRLGSVHPR